MSIYQKRWSSCATGSTPSNDRTSRITPTASNVLSSGVEPSTVGTSWNSVRWNKPSTSYRANMASRFENKPSGSSASTSSYTPQKTSRFLSSAAKNAAEVTSIGPSVSDRASRFDSSQMPNKEKYRSEARDLINKWSSRERTQIGNTFRSPNPRTSYRSSDSLTTMGSLGSGYSSTPYRTSTSLTPTRPIVTTPSSTASRYMDRKSMLSPSPTPMLHTTPKADRPWRQRMAESSRIRSTLGDDVSEAYTARRAANASSRRNSLSQDEGGSVSAYETAYPSTRVPSYSALVQPYSSYRSRQSSVESSVFSPTSRFTNAPTSSYIPYSLRSSLNRDADAAHPTTTTLSSNLSARSTSRSKSPAMDSLPKASARATTSQVPKNPSIRESSKERDCEKVRKKSVKERTARRASRQNSQQDSSSDEEINKILVRSRSGSRIRKSRKKSQIEVPTTPKDNKSMQSSLYETGPEEALINSLSSHITASLAESMHSLALAAESEGFQSCAASPLAPSISRSSSKNGVVKSQIIKSPSLVEVLGLPRSESKGSLKSNHQDPCVEIEDSEDRELTFDVDEPSECSRIDDESQYSAIVHFKPNKIKRIAPVPGMWKSGAENEEFISRNKKFSKEEQKYEAELVIKLKNEEKVAEKVSPPKAGVEKKRMVLKKKKAVPVELKKSESKSKVVKEPLKKADDTKKEDVKAVKKIEAEKPKEVAPKLKEEIKKVEAQVKPKSDDVAQKKVPEKKVEIVKKAEIQQKTQKPKEEIQKPEEIQKVEAQVKPKAPDDVVQKKAEIVKKAETQPKAQKPKEEVKKPDVKPKVEIVDAKPKPAEVVKKVAAKPVTKAEVEQKNEPLKKEPVKKVLSDKKIEITKSFSKKAALPQKANKTLKTKNTNSTTLKCKSCKTTEISVMEHYRRRSLTERATVLVDTPVIDVNHCVLKLSVRERRKRIKKVIEPTPVIEVEPIPEVLSTSMESEDVSRSVSRASETRASVILDEMRYTEPAVEWIRDLEDGQVDDSNELLILPDESILEQYVNRKRGKLERMRGIRPSSICSSRGYESSNCASPCPSTVSELCLPSSAMVHAELRRRAPNSAEPLDSGVQMNSTPRGFTRVQPPPVVVKAVPFETPKTLFEKMIQDQANRNRSQQSTIQIPSDSETRDPSPRRGSEDGMSSISSQFTAAAAAGNSAHGQVRYAAHIPVNRERESGRASAASIDSQKSNGALDVASKNIDQVIDQARHRHHQHRSKFKEAIDYLDQIFEDLKKECDPEEKNNNNSTDVENQKPVVVVASPKKSTTSAQKSPPQKQSSIEVKPKSNTGLKTKSKVAAAKAEAKKQQSLDSPVEVVIPVRKVSKEGSVTAEPTVAETIVLAKKTDKMDFTRRWLQDDLGSLAHLPPANIAPNVSYYQDFDEHSLGSCSAEVAAYNTTKDKKKAASRKTSDTTEAPVRPRPFRPQPIYPMTDHVHSAFEAYSNTLPRVTSTDEMRRSSSQDPYNTLRSMRSEGGGTLDDRPSPSAFQQVSAFSRGGSMRSSLRSLPDHSPVRQRLPKPFVEEKQDPILSIDQLVAELELNTDQPISSIEKRRSFPTSFIRPQQAQQVHYDYEKPRSYRAEMRQAPTRGRVQGFATSEAAPKKGQQIYSQPSQKLKDNHIHQQQKSLDEVTNMLSKVVSQFGNERGEKPHHPSVYKQLSQQSFGSNHGNNAFETINQEKINPSRVEAMHNMFEKGTSSTAWKMQQPRKEESFEDRTFPKMSPLQEAQYATLNHFSTPNINNNGMPRNSSQSQISYHEYTPQVPTTQPPQRPPGSANSSQGGYYSSNSSGIGSNYPQQQYNNTRRSLVMDQPSLSSRVPSVDEDDDGFYDNIGIFNDDRRFSRGSELEASSSFRNLPPASSGTSSHKHNRIGSFLRKIGGGNRPPGSAASLLSLNKIANETVMKPAGLMKSNSLSTEPWKKQVLESNSSMPREANNNHKTGLGARLKNSLFGSRRRLDG